METNQILQWCCSEDVDSYIAPSFMVSAPGKVILYGEHAVVYGKAAIAAAISLRSYLHVSFLHRSHLTVRLRFPDIALDHTWNIKDLPWMPFSQSNKKKRYYDCINSLDPELVQAMQPHIVGVSKDLDEQTRKIHHASASAFLYLFLSLGSPQSAPCVYILRSTIPIGAGLGSSASIAVCISTALLLQARALSGPHHDQPAAEASLQIERINRWAFVSEMCIHGHPSGVDNTVSSGGQAILFKRADHTGSPTMIPLQNFPELPLLIIDTRQSRSTATEVAKVAKLRNKHPGITNKILDAINDVTESAYSLISSDNFDPYDLMAIQHLGNLVTINHGLLVSLGVSHPKLERIRELTEHAGIGWTKLTGAGGGGCAITILKPVPSGRSACAKHATVLYDLEKKLEADGFEKFQTSLTSNGVGVLWPALLRSKTDVDGGREINHDDFLEALGKEEIEKLVGVNYPDQKNDGGMALGWEFWRP